jgi:GT2 family glycosyltransferase
MIGWDRMVYVGIVVVGFNCLDLTQKFVESARTKHPHVMIVVDNGSTDGTSDWAKSMGFEVIRHEENKSIGAGMNAGIKKAIELGCSHIIVSHNDVVVHKDAIDNLVECYDQLRGYLKLLSGVDQGGYWLPPTTFKQPPTKEEVDAFNQIINKCQGEYALFSFFCLSPETINLVGYLDENFNPGAFLDDDYRYRLKKAGFESASCPKAFHWHWGCQTFQRNNISPHGDYNRNRELYIKKWGGGPLEEEKR